MGKKGREGTGRLKSLHFFFIGGQARPTIGPEMTLAKSNSIAKKVRELSNILMILACTLFISFDNSSNGHVFTSRQSGCSSMLCLSANYSSNNAAHPRGKGQIMSMDLAYVIPIDSENTIHQNLYGRPSHWH